MTAWRKSSHSEGGGAMECVEVAELGSCRVGVRDSKAPEAGHLALGQEALADLVTRIRRGELDLP
nr:hypothetical protein GCM10010200_030070 [Actinomadura rugatobispora]